VLGSHLDIPALEILKVCLSTRRLTLNLLFFVRFVCSSVHMLLALERRFQNFSMSY
jgi:uncharacterized membrane protein YkvI